MKKMALAILSALSVAAIVLIALFRVNSLWLLIPVVILTMSIVLLLSSKTPGENTEPFPWAKFFAIVLLIASLVAIILVAIKWGWFGLIPAIIFFAALAIIAKIWKWKVLLFIAYALALAMLVAFMMFIILKTTIPGWNGFFSIGEKDGKTVIDFKADEINFDADGDINIEPKGDANIKPQGDANIEPKGDANIKPQGDVIVTPEKDVVVEPKGDVVVKPEGDVNVEPKGDVNVKPEGDVNVEPKGDVNVKPEGDVNVEPKGDVNVKPEGDINLEPKGDINVNPEGDIVVYPGVQIIYVYPTTETPVPVTKEPEPVTNTPEPITQAPEPVTQPPVTDPPVTTPTPKKKSLSISSSSMHKGDLVTVTLTNATVSDVEIKWADPTTASWRFDGASLAQISANTYRLVVDDAMFEMSVDLAIGLIESGNYEIVALEPTYD